MPRNRRNGFHRASAQDMAREIIRLSNSEPKSDTEAERIANRIAELQDRITAWESLHESD